LSVNFHVKDKNLKGCHLITGFHGLGATGYIAVKHMVQLLKAERIGHVETERLPPFVSIEDGRLVTPFEIFRHNNYVFILTEVPPHPKDRHPFARGVAEWAVREKFDEAVLLGGLDNRLKKEGDADSKCAATGSFKPRLESMKVPLLDKGLYVVGPLATMLSCLEFQDFPAVALLPYADPSRPDPRAAAVAITHLNELYKLEIDTSQLRKDAEKIETEVADLLKRRQDRMKHEQQALYI
jgi:uncharacterized protein